ncbi:MAG: hypothetical protein A2Z70_01815 [Chloroflexi bacterium RBG_13_48_17]|nr:MAG: hypothetical protein A2Z70_01815 [Chloroflexi bacterium RBG_13_48_17]
MKRTIHFLLVFSALLVALPVILPGACYASLNTSPGKAVEYQAMIDGKSFGTANWKSVDVITLDPSVTISVSPTTVSYGNGVTITSTARNDTQELLYQQTRVFKWTRGFLWWYYWKEMGNWGVLQIPPGQSIPPIHRSYTPPSRAKYKAEVTLYNVAGRSRARASAIFFCQ